MDGIERPEQSADELNPNTDFGERPEFGPSLHQSFFEVAREQLEQYDSKEFSLPHPDGTGEINVTDYTDLEYDSKSRKVKLTVMTLGVATVVLVGAYAFYRGAGALRPKRKQ